MQTSVKPSISSSPIPHPRRHFGTAEFIILYCHIDMVKKGSAVV